MLAMIVVSLSCLMTVTVLAVHYPNRHRPLPRWSRAILDMKVAKWLGVDSTTIQVRNRTLSCIRTKGPDPLSNSVVRLGMRYFIGQLH